MIATVDSAPTLRHREEPHSQYRAIDPSAAERPTTGGRPASAANPSDWGTSMAHSVTPASRSARSHARS
jgi:hypothetical protein